MSGDDLILELGKGLTNLDNAALMRMGHHLLRGETGQLANVLHGYAHDVHSFTKGHAAFELGRRSYAFNHPLDTLFEDDLADEYKDYLVDLAGVASEQVSQKVNESLEQARIDGLTVNQAADQLGDVLGGFTRGRLRTIVRTEGTRVASATRHDAAVRAVEAGWGPRWYLFSAILDDRVTRTCTFGHGHRRDVQGEQPWEQAFPAFHYNCFPGETLIATQRGRVAIRDVVIGDQVLTHLGRYRPVVELHRNPSPDRLVEISLSSGGKVTTTSNHPILTQRGWIAAGSLQTSDCLFNTIELTPFDDHVPDSNRGIPEGEKILKTTQRNDCSAVLDRVKNVREIDTHVSEVFNFGVLDDESYVANGYIVHNCRSIYRFLFDDSPEIEVTSEWNAESWEEFRRIQAEEFPSWAQAEGV